MRTGTQLKALGVDSWFHQHANQYVRLLENAGWSDQQIDKAIKFGVNFKGGTEQELIQQFRESGEYISAPELDLVIDAGLGLRDTIQSSGVESLPPLKSEAFTADHAARLAEIRQIARNDPRGFDSNRALQDQQLALLELQQAANGTVAPSQSKPAPSATPAPPATDRLSQIREIARNDPQKYESDHALQQEQLALIEASIPKSAPVSTGTDSAPAAQPASEGTSSE
jgi:hypothetical protein